MIEQIKRSSMRMDFLLGRRGTSPSNGGGPRPTPACRPRPRKDSRSLFTLMPPLRNKTLVKRLEKRGAQRSATQFPSIHISSPPRSFFELGRKKDKARAIRAPEVATPRPVAHEFLTQSANDLEPQVSTFRQRVKGSPFGVRFVPSPRSKAPKSFAQTMATHLRIQT